MDHNLSETFLDTGEVCDVIEDTPWLNIYSDNDRVFDYFVPYNLFVNPLVRISGEPDNRIPFVAPSEFDYPHYFLAENENFVDDKLYLKKRIEGKIEKLNVCFKFTKIFQNEETTLFNKNAYFRRARTQ